MASTKELKPDPRTMRISGETLVLSFMYSLASLISVIMILTTSILFYYKKEVFSMYPRVLINLKEIEENARKVVQMAEKEV